MAFAAVAVDLGATSGRVLLGRVGADELAVEEVARFANGGVRLPDGLHWDILGLYSQVLAGLRAAARDATPVSIGVDTWAVDFGLLGEDGRLLGNPRHYRDERFVPAAAQLLQEIPAAELYARTGIQHLPINTIFQLAAAEQRGELADVARLLLIPDLLAYFLTGTQVTEETNASTTQLLAVHGGWDETLLERVRVPARLFAPLVPPGSALGHPLPHVAAETGLHPECVVRAVASHDTASAVLAVPASDERFAYISSGTWSLVGLELDEAVVTAASDAANFTNERGVDGTVRFLRNVAGFYLLEECRRSFARLGVATEVDALVAEAAALAPRRSLVDVDALALGTGDMLAALRRACAAAGEPIPETPAAVTRCLLDSIAAAYAATLETACALAGRSVDAVHLVGGGARNALLAQLTADACGLPVIAGPTEAAALGNLLVQARAAGVLPADRFALRRLVATTSRLERYAPRPQETAAWRRARSRLLGPRPEVALR